ncbi:MAG: hypothetical protein ACLQVL_22770 [Terriglobia bacterium]
MNIPTYDQWKVSTSAGITQPRSSLMQALDKAIDQYNKSKTPDNLWAIKHAFEAWKSSKGPAWERSDRNRTGAIKRLSVELDGLDYRTYQITHMSMAELQALEFVHKERTKTIAKLFLDPDGHAKPVVFKAANLKNALKEAAGSVKTKSDEAMVAIREKVSSRPTYGPKPFSVKDRITGQGMSPSGGGMGTDLGSDLTTGDKIKAKLNEMVQKFFQVDSLTMLGPLAGIIMEIVAKCSASAAPVIGHISDGVSAIGQWIDVGVGYYDKGTISRCSYSIEMGAPAAAFAALEKLLQSEIDHAAIGAGISSTSFVVKTGLVFADGGAISGPVVGAVTALANIAHYLYLLGMEYRATRDANAALAAGHLDITLFDTYPLMGCYLLNCATLSDIIPIKCFGTPGWKEYIANMKKNAVDRIIDKSMALIDKSPWEIQGMPKKPVGSAGGLFSEAKRFGGPASGLVGGLAGLSGIKKPS